MITQQSTIIKDPSQSDEIIIFNDMKVEQENTIEFIYGLPGFEMLTKFVIKDIEDYPPFKVLQSLEEPDISMLILDIRLLKIREQIKISFGELEKIEIYPDSLGENTEIYVILKVNDKKQELSANVKAPLVINTEKKIGGQIILDDENLSVEYLLKEGLRLTDTN